MALRMADLKAYMFTCYMFGLSGSEGRGEEGGRGTSYMSYLSS